MSETSGDRLIHMTSQIVSAYLANNRVEADHIPDVITSVYSALGNADQSHETPMPAVPIKQSITADYLICLEDGKKLKMLKRHLKSRYSLTPDAYRERWGLPRDYPMVAPNYSKKRARMAKKFGLGKDGG